MRRYNWSLEHLGPVVTGYAREERWLAELPAVPFTRVEAAQLWGVGVHECRRRLQALVFGGFLRRCGCRSGDRLAVYLVVEVKV